MCLRVKCGERGRDGFKREKVEERQRLDRIKALELVLVGRGVNEKKGFSFCDRMPTNGRRER